VFVQVADVVTDTFNAPDWVMQIVIALLVVGLPISIILAWVFDITPDGIVRSQDIDTSQPTLSSVQTFSLVGGMFAVVAVILYLIWPQTSPQTSPPPPTAAGNSIAVLPFLNLSSDAEQEYFSDGLADTLLHQLAQIKDLRVAARTSSFKFKGQNEDIRDIARQLGVATVLEGSVQRQGDRVRITAQLIDGSDGSHIWSRVFDETLDDIFRVQDEIAHNVADALQTSLGDTTVTAGTGIGGTDNVAAYEAYLKGVASSRRGTPEAASQAIVQLGLAVGLDPDYARAWVALSKAYVLTAGLGTASYASTLTPRMHAVEKAVALAPKLPEAHLALANVLRFDGDDTERATAAIEKAAELGPNNAEILAALGELRFRQGLLREALRLTERAVLINPLDPFLQMGLARHRLSVGLEDEAFALAASLTETNPGNLRLFFGFELLLQKNQQFVEAARLTHRVLESNPGMLVGNFILSGIHLSVGDIEQADEYLRRAEAISPNRAWDNRARFCLLTGDLQCYIENTERFLQVQKDGGILSNELDEGTLRLYEGDYKRAIELLQSRVGDTARVTVLNIVDFKVELYLAAAYDKLGDTHNRDALLDQTEQGIHESLANGLWMRLALKDLLQVAAIRGDAQLASENLAATIDANIAPPSGELEHYVLYDSVREHPDFQAQLTRAKAREAEIRAQLTAEKL
jgi:TolB-like protein